MIAVHPDVYLDARRPEWIEAELCGRVVCQSGFHTVTIIDREIERVLREPRG